MSIVALRRVAIVGRLRDRDAVLHALQKLGHLHVVYGDSETRPLEIAQMERAQRVLRELEGAPHPRRPLRAWDGTDPASLETRTLALRDERLNLADERDRLVREIERLAPWGDFRRPAPEEIGGRQLWFYAVPLNQLDHLQALPHPQREIARDNVTAYVVVVAREQPEGTPVEPLDLGERSLSELRRRLEAIEVRLDEVGAERSELGRFRGLMEAHYLRIADQATLQAVRDAARDDGRTPVFVLRGYWPARDLPALEALGERWPLAVVEERVPEGETPPTLLDNHGLAEAGQSLVTFYSTPAADSWDPSAWVMAAFSLFFAMILSDAGYAALLLALALVAWRKLNRSAAGRTAARMLLALGCTSALWGIAIGSYFGTAPRPDSWLASVAKLDVTDAEQMMALSVWLGAGHLALANLRHAFLLRGRASALAPLGWSVLIGAGLCAWQNAERPALGLGAVGLVLVLGWSAPDEGVLGRLLGGLKGLAGVTGAFGDVLSYLRLFALGLASASLASAFNDLAADAREGALGLVSAVLILIIGHSLNLALGVMGGFVHGLRLNFIEFFKWGLPGEGRPYRPFRLLSTDPEEP